MPRPKAYNDWGEDERKEWDEVYAPAAGTNSMKKKQKRRSSSSSSSSTAATKPTAATFNSAPPTGKALVGSVIEVFWPKDQLWYKGVVKSYTGGQHKVVYTSSRQAETYELLNLKEEKYKIVVAATETTQEEARAAAAAALAAANCTTAALAAAAAAAEATVDKSKLINLTDILDMSGAGLSDGKSSGLSGGYWGGIIDGVRRRPKAFQQYAPPDSALSLGAGGGSSAAAAAVAAAVAAAATLKEKAAATKTNGKERRDKAMAMAKAKEKADKEKQKVKEKADREKARVKAKAEKEKAKVKAKVKAEKEKQQAAAIAEATAAARAKGPAVEPPCTDKVRFCSRDEIQEGDLVWVKYARYADCVWPGKVLEVLSDETEVLMCQQQALDGRLTSGVKEVDLEDEKVFTVEWYNHYSSGDGEVFKTENEFLGRELTPFANGFKERWRRRAHIRVGDVHHKGEYFNRAVHDAVQEWITNVAPTPAEAAAAVNFSSASTSSATATACSSPSSFAPTAHSVAAWLGIATLHGELAKTFTAHADGAAGDAAKQALEALAAQWNCVACSYVNSAVTSACEMCGTQREGVTTTSRLGRANSRKRKLGSPDASFIASNDNSNANDGDDDDDGRRRGSRGMSTRDSRSKKGGGGSSIAAKKLKPPRQFEPTGFLGQGMSGSLTNKSVSNILKRCNIAKGDRFIDLGAGVGNVTLQVAEELPGLEWARGIECIEEAWAESCFRCEELKGSGKKIAPLQFHLGDLMLSSPEHLCNASHVYIFAAGMPPELQLQLFRLLCQCDDFVKQVICVIDGSLGQNKTSLSSLLNKSKKYNTIPNGKLHGSMKGSGSGKTIIIFEASKP